MPSPVARASLSPEEPLAGPRSGRRRRLTLLLLVLGLGVSEARAQTQVRPPAPPAPAPGDADDAETQPDVIVTASRRPELALDTAWSASVIDVDVARSGPDGRSLPELLTREPGVLLQKTGPGQSSPYLRGFTGFRTLWLVDGIRLNNSVWRDGPNQYSSTIDAYAVDRLEVVRGPGSVLWGSDAIGGTIHAITDPADPAAGRFGAYELRAAGGERSVFHRVDFQDARDGGWGLKGGVTWKHFGEIQAGSPSDALPGTGFRERDVDARLDLPDADGPDLSFGAQSVRQYGVPRTHKTVDAVSFHGTTVGSELMRELDQSRDLLWGRAAWEGEGGGLVDEAAVTVSVHRQQEQQRRLRTGGRYDEQGFDVTTTGVQMQLGSDTPAGFVTWGVDAWHDEVSSFRRDTVFGSSPTTAAVAGPVADDSSYDLLGAYVQDERVDGDFETTVGLRGTWARADAGAFDNPNVAGSSPSTPGNVLSTRERWNDVSASLRGLLHVDDQTSVWAGLSQGFRAPNLSDLTADLEDSGAESPTPDLDPEHFLSLELGAKLRSERWSAELALHRTWIRDMIVRSPTGAFVGTTPVFRKDNVGDGWVHGAELHGERRVGDELTLFGSLAWLDGEVDQVAAGGGTVTEPLDRLMPLTGLAGVTFEPESSPWWLQADVLAADKADRLSLRDQADTERVPPGGTPGYGILGLRGGVTVRDGLVLGLALENVFDRDYRIHGSGQNEPGRSLVFTGRVQF